MLLLNRLSLCSEAFSSRHLANKGKKQGRSPAEGPRPAPRVRFLTSSPCSV